jgi:cytochrome P450
MEVSNDRISWFAKLYNTINLFFLRSLGKFWVFQYLGPIYPGIVSHFNNDISESFYKETILNGESTSSFFDKIGLRSFASRNGGLCTFKLGNRLALYQVTNVPLVKDSYLSPSTGPNQKLFGNFMGTYQCDDPIRKKKRQILVKKLSNVEYILKLKPFIQKYANEFLKNSLNRELSLESFAMEIVSYVDSYLPGILDVTNRPLTSFLCSHEYGKVMRDFFELASDVISKLDVKAFQLAQSIAPVIRNLIKDNFKSIKAADETNIIKQYFCLENISFNEKNLDSLSDDFLKELGTIIVALYDTTSLSLYWLMCYIEDNHVIKQKIIQEANNEFDINKISFIELAIIEGIRLAGNNPTALWREVKIPTEIAFRDTKIHLRKGMMLWLDRRAANQDENIFPQAKTFNPNNIKSIFEKEKESIFSILNHNRYEINSFSMVNTLNNPRKCPGRYFSIFVQSCLIREIYGHYQVNSKDIDIKLRKHCSMPRPDNQAKVIFHAK